MKTQTFSTEKRKLLELLLREKGVVSAPVNGASFHGFQLDGKDAFPLSFSQQRLWFGPAGAG